MQIVMKSCPVCRYGMVGFRVCEDSSVLFVMCDECDSVWLDLDAIGADTAMGTSPPEFYIGDTGCSIVNSRWATREVVESFGRERLVVGVRECDDW